MGNLFLDNKINIANSFFNDFDVISDGAVRLYFAMKLEEKLRGVKNYTASDIQRITAVSDKTFKQDINDLEAMGYVGKRGKGDEYEYYLSPYVSTVDGFTIIKTITIESMLNELTDGEMKLYSYLCYMIGENEENCGTSKKYIAKKIGLNMDVEALDSIYEKLAEKRFLRIEVEKEEWATFTTYSLIC